VTASIEVGDELADLPGAGHVDAGRGLIEKENGGRMDDSGGNGELAFHAFGIAAELASRRLLQAEAVEQFPGPALAGILGHTIE
jgi:hypothetical protein